MTRLLYEKHVPADPLLARLRRHASRPAARGWPRWLAGALGGPRRRRPGGDLAGRLAWPRRPDSTEEQRARWVALAGTAADEAGLPADAAFPVRVLRLPRVGVAHCRLGRADAAAAGAAAGALGLGPGRAAALRRPGAGDGGRADDRAARAGRAGRFAAHIRPLFRQRDRQSMSFAFDLWSYDDVRAHAADILARLQDGSMPCDGAWPPDRIEVLGRWINAGHPA